MLQGSLGYVQLFQAVLKRQDQYVSIQTVCLLYTRHCRVKNSISGSRTDSQLFPSPCHVRWEELAIQITVITATRAAMAAVAALTVSG